MADEVNEAFKVTYQLLHADAPLVALVGDRIYDSSAPSSAIDAGLYIVGDFFGGSDVQGLGDVRLATNPLFLWRVIRKGQLNAGMRTATDRVDEVLQVVSYELSGGYVFTVRRERPHRRTFHDSANNQFTESGGYYRYYISKM